MLALTSIVQPMVVPAEIIRLDIRVMCAAIVVLLLFARAAITKTAAAAAPPQTSWLVCLGT